MNDRIEKIYERAAHELNQQFFSRPDNWDELLRAKFAELLVRECAQEAFEFWCQQRDEAEESARSHILNHFGF
jgi:hypothetical protein